MRFQQCHAAGCDEVNDATGQLYDCIGIGVRIDNELLTNKSMPVVNGAFDDDESLTTNVDDEVADTGVAPAFFIDELHDGEGLTWAKLEIEYSQSGNLFVAYKGREIINQAIEYEPSPGFLVFGGRTGGTKRELSLLGPKAIGTATRFSIAPTS